MTKKDYELIAYVIITVNLYGILDEYMVGTEDELAYCSYALRMKIAEWMAYNLQKDNNRFDKQRFMKACGQEL